jgi:hypothetical protein
VAAQREGVAVGPGDAPLLYRHLGHLPAN